MTNNVMKPLSFFKLGEKFKYNNQVYTVYAHDRGMTEVLCNDKFWAWPHWTGKEEIKMEVLPYGENK